MPVTISKKIFKPVSTGKPLKIVFWSFCYLLSWHLNIQIVLHCCWHVLFLSLSCFMHICFISQFDSKLFEFRWCVNFSFPLFSCAVENLGILYLFVVTSSFTLQVAGRLIFLHLDAFLFQQEGWWTEQKWGPSQYFLLTVRTEPSKNTLCSCFKFRRESQPCPSAKVLSPVPCHPSFPFSCLVFLLALNKFQRMTKEIIWKYNNLM